MSKSLSQPEIRELSGMSEFRQAETLQNEVWGKDDTADPADLLMVIQAEGGLCAGAFLEGRLIGSSSGRTRITSRLAAEVVSARVVPCAWCQSCSLDL
jgi:predicted GNAT superfamily acetyltransferase